MNLLKHCFFFCEKAGTSYVMQKHVLKILEKILEKYLLRKVFTFSKVA